MQVGYFPSLLYWNLQNIVLTFCTFIACADDGPLVRRLTNWVLSHQTTAACTTFSYSCIYKAYYQPILGKLSFCPFRIYQIDLNFMKNIKSMFWLSLLLLVVFPRNKIIICSITDLSFESPDQQTNGILRPLNMYMFPLQEIELR